MRILITCATKQELEPLLSKYQKNTEPTKYFGLSTTSNKQIDVLFSGVGMLSTCFALTQHLQHNRYDMVLNVGIAGSVTHAELGKVYQVMKEHVYELGAENRGSFIALQDMNFLSYDDPLHDKFFAVSNKVVEVDLPKATGITVNKIHGTASSIERLHACIAQEGIQDAVIESMEGAAFAYVCRQLNQAAIQVRSVSNIVEERNRENWKMKEAIKALNDWLFEFIEKDG